MIEQHMIAWLKSGFPDVPIYTFEVPINTTKKVFVIESAGFGVASRYFSGSQIESRSFKLTVSSTDVQDIFDDAALTKFIKDAPNWNGFKLLSCRVLNHADDFSDEQTLYERTYTIQVKYKNTY
ncbi:hypothetical protein [Vibrio fluvialis]|uniref:hypothetical protein n=1 Tax=Vibrio fluvialis TaxID=676 RepID=UPI001C9CCFF8|nr:hypothetical protein [Vibrio fluvialis]MBY8157103.1 hypothetical protein [Vibrio fluvialis]MCG6410407.1 hypothetical protein [Vibrio fluvialis]MDT8865858.1 hypothetical protein [Vibrio fluvialis]MDT8873626.1 hypothetical protein [Vibrio fluvialis]